MEVGATLGDARALPAGLLDASAAAAAAISPQGAADLQRVAGELAQHTEAIADAINARVIEQVPGLVDDDDPTSLAAAAHSMQANVGAILSMLAYGVPGSAIQPPVGALELFERMAERDEGLVLVLRCYRLGIAELWQVWARHVHASVDDAAGEHEILAASTSFMLTYVDCMSEQLIERWSDTRRRRRRGLDVPPEELIRQALFGDAGGAEGLRRLSYELDRVHIALALPPSLDEAEVNRLASRARLVAQAHTVAMQHDGGWIVWVGVEKVPDQPVVTALEELFDREEPVGRGGAAGGIEGFRSTYREALDARRVGLLRHSTGVTRYRDVALLSVLCADTVRARALARAELGPLVVEDEVNARLRETLTVYFSCGESHVAAAQLLHVHQKTVAYRIRQAEKLLGRKVGERRAELEAALLLHRAFDGQV